MATKKTAPKKTSKGGACEKSCCLTEENCGYEKSSNT